MKNDIAYQASFGQGMNESKKPDVDYEQTQVFQSALWLENYNHTLQQDSAIMRWGQRDASIPNLDTTYFCPNETYDLSVNGDVHLERDHASLLQGVQIYDIVRPESNTNYTCFLRRYPNKDADHTHDYLPQFILDDSDFQSSEAVAVVTYTTQATGDTPAWIEVFADGTADSDLRFAGWYTFGSLSDVVRYGETLLFTTTLSRYLYNQDYKNPYYPPLLAGAANPVNRYLFPVYRYLFWDLSKKWSNDNQFLNGLPDYNEANILDPVFRKWKVLPPAQYLLNNLDVGFTNGVAQGVDATALGGGGAVYDINISIEECPSMGYKVSNVPPSQTIQSSKYYPTWLGNKYNEQIGEDDYKALVPQSEIFSIEELDLPQMNGKLYGAYSTLFRSTVDNGTASYLSQTRFSNISPLINGTPGDTIDPVSGIYDLPSPTNITHVGVSALEKYTESGSPRMFLYKETVDMVLTANIGGVDVLLFRGVYEVRQLPTSPTPKATPDGYNYHFRYDLPWLDMEGDLGDLAFAATNDPSTYFDAKRGGKYYPQGRGAGSPSPDYHLYHMYGSYIYFTIDIRKEVLELLINANCSSISLWAIKPDTNRHIIKSLGTSFDDPSGAIYNKPLIQGNENVDYTKYALLKKFVIDGYTAQPTTYENWTGKPLATNGWYQRTDASSRLWATAVPLASLESGLAGPMGLPDFPNEANVISYLDGSTTLWEVNEWTPDFVMWDYPTETTLFLNSSGKYWKGLGARLIVVIKGRTFIGGCIGGDGIEEQAIIRYSDTQGGAISPDVFSEERKLQVGHQPHVALLEFREQLWAFSRYQFYRIQMPSITDETSWEYNDVVEQGTFSNKSFVVVPYGVCFANEGGIWLSEGGEPQNFALPILPTYQRVTSNKGYQYTTINALANEPYTENGNNPYLELSYDSFNDELLCYTPLFESFTNEAGDADYKPVTEFTFIFSFKYRSWRIETSLVPEYEVESAI